VVPYIYGLPPRSRGLTALLRKSGTAYFSQKSLAYPLSSTRTTALTPHPSQAPSPLQAAGRACGRAAPDGAGQLVRPRHGVVPPGDGGEVREVVGPRGALAVVADGPRRDQHSRCGGMRATGRGGGLFVPRHTVAAAHRGCAWLVFLCPAHEARS
jgi:hypothetical protein